MSKLLKGKIENHFIHCFERSAANKSIYRCTHPLCTYYQNKAYLIGKLAECPKCHEGFILEKEKLRYKTPVCLKCSKSPKRFDVIENTPQAEVNNVVNDIMDEILGNRPLPNDEL